MIRPSRSTDDGFTGLELVIIIVILISVTAILILNLGGGDLSWSRTFPGGAVAESTYMSGDTVRQIGFLYGFPFVSKNLGSTPIMVARRDPSSLGAVQMVVSLFIGSTGAIDMDRARVQWSSAKNAEPLSRSAGTVLVCPNWTISHKYNLLPGRTADSDDWLEPGEQFELTLCPSAGVPPNGVFTISVGPEGMTLPLSLTRTVPPAIRPVMNLG